MINIKYELYRHDYDKGFESKSFSSMAEFKNWMFNSMNQPYVAADGYKNMYFLDTYVGGYRQVDTGAEIKFRPDRSSPHYWIHYVEDNGKVVFSNGRHTNNQCYMSEGFKAFMQECMDKRDGKVQSFVFGEVAGYTPVVEKTAKEKAVEFIKNNREVAREIYNIFDKDYYIEDVKGKIEERDSSVFDNISDKEIERLAAKFQNSLSKNDSYFEAYWASLDNCLDEFIKEKKNALKVEFEAAETAVREFLREEMNEDTGEVDVNTIKYKETIDVLKTLCEHQFPALVESVFGRRDDDFVFKSETGNGDYFLYYFNPDSNTHGQIVKCEMSVEQAALIADGEEAMEVLCESRQYCSDINMIHFFHDVLNLVEMKQKGCYIAGAVQDACRVIVEENSMTVDGVLGEATSKADALNKTTETTVKNMDNIEM